MAWSHCHNTPQRRRTHEAVLPASTRRGGGGVRRPREGGGAHGRPRPAGRVSAPGKEGARRSRRRRRAERRRAGATASERATDAA